MSKSKYAVDLDKVKELLKQEVHLSQIAKNLELPKEANSYVSGAIKKIAKETGRIEKVRRGVYKLTE